MLGKSHTEEFKQAQSTRSKERWANPGSALNSAEHRQHLSDRNALRHASGNFYNDKANAYSRCQSGWFENDGKKYFMRSKWEQNYAWYLTWLEAKGDIASWEYEVDTFWFESIRRGVRSYKPDFKIKLISGDHEYHEVKGWMDDKSKTKIKRMAKYYPDVKLIIIDSDAYKSIQKWSRLIPGWF